MVSGHTRTKGATVQSITKKGLFRRLHTNAAEIVVQIEGVRRGDTRTSTEEGKGQNQLLMEETHIQDIREEIYHAERIRGFSIRGRYHVHESL